MELTLTIFKIFLLGKLITEFTPLSWIVELLPNNMLKYILVVLTSCLRCCMTWVAFAMTGDIFIAAGASIVGSLFTSIEQNIITLWIKKINKQ